MTGRDGANRALAARHFGGHFDPIRSVEPTEPTNRASQIRVFRQESPASGRHIRDRNHADSSPIRGILTPCAIILSARTPIGNPRPARWPMNATSGTPRALAQAIKLHAAGYWVIPIRPGQKRPIGKDWGTRRQGLDDLHAAFRAHPDAGIGIALGPGRGPGGSWLIDLEGDGPAAADSLATLLTSETPDTPSWSSTRGDHTLFTADGTRLLEILGRAGAKPMGAAQSGAYHLPELPDLEFRIGGTKPDGSTKQLQSVAPPTEGTDGRPRAWTRPPKGGLAPLPEAAYARLEIIAAGRTPTETKASKPIAGTAPPTSPARPRAETRAARYLETIEPAISGSGGHAKTFAAACRVGPGFDLPPDVTLDLLKRHYNPRCEPPWSDVELAHKVEEAYKVEADRGWLLRVPPDANGNADVNGNGRPTAPRPPATDAPDRRPEIAVTVERHIVAGQALNALESDPDLYRRGDTLGTAFIEPQDTAELPHGIQLHRTRGSTRFMPLSDANLGLRLTAAARFHQHRADKNGEPVARDCHPPDWLIKAINSLGRWPRIRPLETICSTPYVRPDGSLPTPGYDGSTGTLYSPHGPVDDPPDRPTAADAREAAGMLFDMVHQFPFATGFDFAAWLAGLLTAIQRPTIAGPVPGIAVNGNRAGVGKGTPHRPGRLHRLGTPHPHQVVPHRPHRSRQGQALHRAIRHRRRPLR